MQISQRGIPWVAGDAGAHLRDVRLVWALSQCDVCQKAHRGGRSRFLSQESAARYARPIDLASIKEGLRFGAQIARWRTLEDFLDEMTQHIFPETCAKPCIFQYPRRVPERQIDTCRVTASRLQQ